MKQIKYEDFLSLGANALPQDLQVDFVSYLKFFLDDGIHILETNLKNNLNIKAFPSRKPDGIIGGILASSPKELISKRRDKNYYICSAVCLLEVIRRIFIESELHSRLTCSSAPEILLRNYEHILKYMLIDAEELQNLYRVYMLNNPQYISCIDARYVHYMPIHQLLRQSLYGQVSYNSFADMEISSSIALIRQLIEVRIRRKFGVLSYIDANGGFQPLNLSAIFACLKKYKKEIVFHAEHGSLGISSIERIYKWANMYVHSGKTELSWIPYYIENLLKTFSFGRKTEYGWDVNNGICASKETVQLIQEQLKKDIEAKHPGWNIVMCSE